MNKTRYKIATLTGSAVMAAFEPADSEHSF